MSKKTLLTTQSATEGPSINPRFQAAKKKPLEVKVLADALRLGDRSALAQSITLVESTSENDKGLASDLLSEVYAYAGNARRIGISGVPGVGKSTFLESFGTYLLAKEPHAKLAVLAIDPSSTVSGGSILGDKTRMSELANHPRAFIRPTASGGSLGGVARSTREAMVLCEAAGYTHIFIETVGVGQSEVAVAQLVDCFLFLAMPGTGDELQGIKKGIMEKADLIVVNKNDGANLSSAKRTKMELARALQLTMHANFDWIPPVVLASGIMKTGFNEVEDAINRFFRHSMAQGWFEENRKNQNKYWFETSVLEGMLALFQSNENWRKEHEHYMSEVSKGAISPFEASRKLLKIIK